MNKILLFIFLFSITVFGNDLEKTPSSITEVTVYVSGAQINRIATVNIKPGINEIFIHNLSPDINENSIQISGLKDASVLSMNYTIDYLEKKKESEELQSLRNQLQALLLKKNNLDHTIFGLQQEQNLIDNNQHIGSDNAPLSLEKVKEISTYYRERSILIKNEVYLTTQKITDLDQNIKDLTNEINKLDSNSKEQRGEIRLKLDALSASNLALKISYTVNNAGWFPLYDIKSKSTSTPLNIAYKANVYQQTGSDWENVRVTLSTGNPNTNNSKPQLNSKYLNFVYNNSQLLGLMSAKLEDNELEEVAEISIRGMASKDVERKEIAYNKVVEAKEEGITNTRFTIKKKYSINSNADVTVIEIDNFNLKADYQYYAAPELNENVFLTAKLGNWEQFDLLAGEANIYFEGSYAGKTIIDPQATTDSLTISLGVDPNIVIQREQLDNQKSKSFIGSARIIDRGYTIEIKNNKKRIIHLMVEDRIPISQNKEIKLNDIETGDALYDTKTGIIKWKLDIAPNQKEEKQFSYQVKYPKNQRINL